jgi:hypothetical protein
MRSPTDPWGAWEPQGFFAGGFTNDHIQSVSNQKKQKGLLLCAKSADGEHISGEPDVQVV